MNFDYFQQDTIRKEFRSKGSFFFEKKDKFQKNSSEYSLPVKPTITTELWSEDPQDHHQKSQALEPMHLNSGWSVGGGHLQCE